MSPSPVLPAATSKPVFSRLTIVRCHSRAHLCWRLIVSDDEILQLDVAMSNASVVERHDRRAHLPRPVAQRHSCVFLCALDFPRASCVRRTFQLRQSKRARSSHTCRCVATRHFLQRSEQVAAGAQLEHNVELEHLFALFNYFANNYVLATHNVVAVNSHEHLFCGKTFLVHSQINLALTRLSCIASFKSANVLQCRFFSTTCGT
jgi:hypothetical protein